tara:strand:+ start:1533 stop:2120 length:588 start_codon:yes stop_codon:yes gene_type:complete
MGNDLAINTEIERRFLVDGRNSTPWRVCEASFEIKQYYLNANLLEFHENNITYSGVKITDIASEEFKVISQNPDWVSRIRIINDKIIFTMKGKRVNSSALELEWVIDSIPTIDGFEELPHIEKTRYNKRSNDGLLWEIDEFEGLLAGLILAEVELQNATQEVEIPAWVGIELTGLANWSNAELAKMLDNAKLLKN